MTSTDGRGGRQRLPALLRCLAEAFISARQSERSQDALQAADLLDWSRRMLPAHFRLPPSRMHRWLAEQLTRFDVERGCRLNVIGPRGSAKSTVGTLAYVLRGAVAGREPYIWIVSDTRRQAAAHLENIRTELEMNSLLASCYPQATGVGKPWRRHALGLPNGVKIEAIGTGERIRGRRRGANRPTLIVCDDLQNDSHIDSVRARQSSRQWFEGTLLQAGTPRTNVLNLATALHREALAWQLTETPGWVNHTFRAIEQWPRRMDLWDQWQAMFCNVAMEDHLQRATEFYQTHEQAMLEGSQLLWPEEEPLLHLMQLRAANGRSVFDREKQSNPIDPDRCEWPSSYFDEHIWFDDWPDRFLVKVMALDPSKGGNAKRADDSAFVMIGVTTEQVVYVEADLARRPMEQIVADGVEHYRRFQPHTFGIEANQFQELLQMQFQQEFAARHMAASGISMMHNQVNKQVRIRRIGPLLAQRRLRFLSGSSGTKRLVEQLESFPQAAHDDGPDALEMAIRLAQQLTSGPIDDGLGDRLRIW